MFFTIQRQIPHKIFTLYPFQVFYRVLSHLISSLSANVTKHFHPNTFIFYILLYLLVQYRKYIPKQKKDMATTSMLTSALTFSVIIKTADLSHVFLSYKLAFLVYKVLYTAGEWLVSITMTHSSLCGKCIAQWVSVSSFVSRSLPLPSRSRAPAYAPA